MAEPSEAGQGPTAREWVERRLREAVLSHPGAPFDEHELQHLVDVVLHSSVLLHQLYSDERLLRLLRAGAASALPEILFELPGRGGDEVSLRRLGRLPDEVRTLGDQCLFDVGVTGMTNFRGFSLPDLGVRAYGLASELLGLLSDDRRLKGFFDRNRLRPLPLEEEINFLRQCAGRFSLHADLLRRISLLDPSEGGGLARGTGTDSVLPRDILGGGMPANDFALGIVGLASAPPRAKDGGAGTSRAEAALAGSEERAVVEDAPADRPPAPPVRTIAAHATGAPEGAAPSVEAAGEEGPVPSVGQRPKPDETWPPRSREEILAAYERLLLFSTLDIEALGQELSALVVGQQEAVATLCDEFALYAAGTQDPARPASYFFVGPTGVGKNYLVESLSRILAGQWDVEVPFLQIEGPNYTEASDINELRGSTRGFIRSDEEGLLAEFHERVIRSPFSVILVDEVEKAHPHLRKFFLPMMDRGALTDNRGRTLRFAGSMLVFTSNIGYSESAQDTAPIGYLDEDRSQAATRGRAEAGLRRTLSPEFMNRLKVVRFRHLGRGSIEGIFDLEFERIASRFREVHGIEIVTSRAAREELISRGYSREFGARHMRAVLDRHCNVGAARKIRSDQASTPVDHRELLQWLRDMRAGERAFDAREVRERVLGQARARLPYDTLEIDLADDGFVYRPGR